MTGILYNVASMNIRVCTLVHPQTSPSAAPNKDNTSTPPVAEGSTQWRHTCVQCIHGAQIWKTNKQAQRMLNILKVSLLLTMHALIVVRRSVILSLWCQRQTFHSQEYIARHEVFKLYIHTCMVWSILIQSCTSKNSNIDKEDPFLKVANATLDTISPTHRESSNVYTAMYTIHTHHSLY